VIGGEVFALFEVQTVDSMGSVEDTIDLNTVDIEIRFHLILRQIELCLLHLSGIVEAVIRLKLKIGAHGLAGIGFNGGSLLVGIGAVSLDEVAQESVDILGCLCHGLLQGIGCIVVIAHDLAFLGSEFGHLHDDRQCVVLACAVTAMDGSLVDTASQVTVVEVGEDRLLGGVDDNDGIRRLATTALSVFLALGDVGLTETGKLLFAVDPYDSIVGSFLKKRSPLLLQVGDALVDLFDTSFLVL